MIVALGCAAASAQPRGGPQSVECRQALDALELQEARAASAPHRREALKQLDASRRQAARTCLGGSGDAPPPSAHFTQPLRGVPAPTPMRPAATPAIRLPPPVPLSPPPDPPPTIVTGCDATGCWTNNGTRLQRLGPALMGPRGLCTGAGPIVQCP